MKRYFLAAKLLFSASLLGLLFWKFPISDAVAAMQGTNRLPLAGAIFLLLPMVLLGGCQVLCLTRAQTIPLSLRDIIRINLANNFYALFLPGALAMTAKWYKFAQEGKKPAQAAAVILYNRFLETFTVALVGVLFFLPDPLTGTLHGLKTASLLLLAGLLIGYALLLTPWLPQKLEQYCTRLPLPGRISAKPRKLIASMQGFHQFRWQDHVGLHAILLFKNGLGVLSIFWLARALDLELSIVQIGWVRSVVMLLAILPLSFSGLGIREGALVILLNTYGIPPAEALALSFLIFFRDLLPAMSGGLLELRNFFRKPLLRTIVQNKQLDNTLSN